MMAEEVMDILRSNIDTLWVIDCAILVFIMQAGFMCMETGLSRHKNSINVALKNAADFGVSVVIFWIFGFGLMFGTTYNGFFGTDLFFFKQKTAYEISACLVGSEMCIRDRINGTVSSIAPLLPPLNPNQPNHKIKVPKTAKGKLEPVNLPLLASEYLSLIHI